MIQTKEIPAVQTKRIHPWKDELKKLTVDNPVLIKELRTRMRGSKTYVLLGIYLGLLTVVLGVTYIFEVSAQTVPFISGGGQSLSDLGRNLFYALFCIQASLISLILPVITASTITLEKEQRTYESLCTTQISAWQIILGKMLPAVLLNVLLVTSSLPLIAVTFMLGGVSPSEIIINYAVLIVCGFPLAGLGIALSASSRKTMNAITLTIGLLVLYIITGAVFSMSGFGGNNSPLIGLCAIHSIFGVFFDMEPVPFFGIEISGWIFALIFNFVIGCFLVSLAVQNLSLYERRMGFPIRIEWAILVLIFALFSSGQLWGWQPNTSTMSNIRENLEIHSMIFYIAGLLSVIFFSTFSRDENIRKIPLKENPKTAPLYLMLLTIASILLFALGYLNSAKPVSLIPYLKIAAIVSTTILAWSLLGMLISNYIPNKKTSTFILLGIMLGAMLLPTLTFISYDPNYQASFTSIGLSSFQAPSYMCFNYLISPLAILNIISPADFYKNYFAFAHHTLPFWGYSALLYLGISFILFIFLLIPKHTDLKKTAKES